MASNYKKGKDWDKIIRDFEEEEKKKDESTADELFREIYSKGNDEVRRAMVKSFTESAGTVLSTNWDQVSKEQTPIKPPEGCSFQKWK